MQRWINCLRSQSAGRTIEIGLTNAIIATLKRFQLFAFAEFAGLRKMRENAAMISALLIMFPLIMYLRKKIPQPAHTNDYSDPSHNLARTTEK